MTTVDNSDTNEVHLDVRVFKETRQSVTELMRFKSSMMDIEGSDIQKIQEMRQKALSAIDAFFDSHLNK